MEEAFWQGEKVNATRGTGVMVDSPQFPQFWGRTSNLIGQRVPVVKVKMRTDDEPFYLYNRDNEGWRKLTEGKGSPRWPHRDLDVIKFIADEVGA